MHSLFHTVFSFTQSPLFKLTTHYQIEIYFNPLRTIEMNCWIDTEFCLSKIRGRSTLASWKKKNFNFFFVYFHLSSFGPFQSSSFMLFQTFKFNVVSCLLSSSPPLHITCQTLTETLSGKLSRALQAVLNSLVISLEVSWHFSRETMSWLYIS